MAQVLARVGLQVPVPVLVRALLQPPAQVPVPALLQLPARVALSYVPVQLQLPAVVPQRVEVPGLLRAVPQPPAASVSPHAGAGPPTALVKGRLRVHWFLAGSRTAPARASARSVDGIAARMPTLQHLLKPDPATRHRRMRMRALLL